MKNNVRRRLKNEDNRGLGEQSAAALFDEMVRKKAFELTSKWFKQPILSEPRWTPDFVPILPSCLNWGSSAGLILNGEWVLSLVAGFR